MKTNKKLKLNTKKVVILSNEQQNAIQGGAFTDSCLTDGCTAPPRTNNGCGVIATFNAACFTKAPMCTPA